MTVKVEENKLKKLIKEAVREVIREEEFTLFLSRIPEVSDEEQREIEEIHGEPGEKEVALSVDIEV